MYYYNITEFNEFKERKRDGVLYQYAVLEDYDLQTLKEVLQNPDSDTKGDYLRELTEVYNRNEINECQYIRLCKAIADGKFVTKTKLKDPLYYIHVLPTAEGYLNFVKTVKYPLLRQNRETPNLEYKVKFTKAEIEELKRNERFKSIDFDKCLEEVEEDEE